VGTALGIGGEGEVSWRPKLLSEVGGRAGEIMEGLYVFQEGVRLPLVMRGVEAVQMGEESKRGSAASMTGNM
jgi:hypothetical protein